MTVLLAAVPLAAMAAALGVLWLAPRTRLHPGWLATAVAAGLLAVVGRLVPAVRADEVVRVAVPWFPALDVHYALALDGLALLFVLLILAAGALIFAYSTAYMERSPVLPRFYAFLLLFAGAMLGVVLADDLVLLYVFWELTSLASFFLIGYENESAQAREGATQALVVTAGGGLALLAGLVLLAQIGGSWQLSALAAHAPQIAADPRSGAVLALVLLAAFTKSAQVPFHFWLPGAMVAPTPVSTYLHSATMVWAGVYLMARLLPVLGGTPMWTAWIAPVGLATMLTGAALALVQRDLKALLAYATISALGQATALIGWGTPAALVAALAHVLVHGAYKAALFLVAGAVEHETGTRLIERLGGLRRAMPLTAAAAAGAGLSLAGLPPFGGFLTKEAAVDALGAAAATPGWGGWLPQAIMIAGGGLAVAYAVRFLRIFAGEPAPAVGDKRRRTAPSSVSPSSVTPSPTASLSAGSSLAATRTGGGQAACSTAHHQAHEPPLLLWGPSMLLAVVGLVFGVAPGGIETLANLAAGVLRPGAPGVHLWHGWNAQVAAVTLASLVLGAGAAMTQRAAVAGADAVRWLSPGRLYELGYAATQSGAKALTAAYMTGELRHYLLYILAATALLVGIAIVPMGIKPNVAVDLGAGEALAVLVGAAAALAAARLRLLVGAILSLGVAGYAVSLIYLLLSAPDLAMTQAVIETVSLVLLLVAVSAIGKAEAHPPDRHTFAERVMLLVSGAGAGVLALLAADPSSLPRVSAEYFGRAAQAGGTNLVNLILLDFRGWDTVGEITVLAIAAMGLVSLAPAKFRPGLLEPALVRRRPAPQTPPMSTVVLRTISLAVVPFILLFALRLWWTGHYGPGGGFVGGLMVAAALALVALAFGAGRLAAQWDVVMAGGLLLAYASAIVPLAVGAPLLTHTIVQAGPLRAASSLVFDLGILVLVTGTVMAAIRALVEAA